MARLKQKTVMRLIGIALVCAVIPVGMYERVHAQEAQAGLFTAATAGEAAHDRQLMALVRSRAVGVDLAKLPKSASVEKPAQLVLNAFENVTLIAEITGIEQQGFDTVTYLGHIHGFQPTADSQDADPSSVSLVVSAGVMVGSIVTPDASYQVRFDGQTQVIRQVDPDRYPETDDAVPFPANMPQSDPGPVAAHDDGSRIDVMVVYTSGARAAEGSTAAMQALITLGITETNQAYANSGIGTRLRLVHMAEVAYAATGDPGLDLNRITNPSDGQLDFLHTWRNTYGADLVQLITTDASCGIGWLGGPFASMGGQQDRGWSVADNECISPNYTFAHEMGHNQGAHHAPEDGGTGGAYTFSNGFKRCGSAPYFRSIMAYACTFGQTGTPRSKNFSNPAVNFGGAATGTATQNNGLTLHNTRIPVSNWRQQVPLIDVTALYPPADEGDKQSDQPSDKLGEGSGDDGAIAQDRRVGQTTTLWAYVRNNSAYTLPASNRVWFYTDGPGSSTGEGWVGSDTLAGLAPGAGAWFSFDWTIPTDAAPGSWVYWAIVYDAGEYLSDWQGPQAFSVISVSANITSVYPVSGAQAGQSATLWALVHNTGGGAFPANTTVYYYVNGPSGPNNYVGYTAASGLGAGVTNWFSFDWTIPPGSPAGVYTYYAIVWNVSANGVWRNLSNWSSGQNFNVAAAPGQSGNVDNLYTVTRADTGGATQRGFGARLWANGRNSGVNAHDANMYLWYYVVGPGGAIGYVGSKPTVGQASNTTVWRDFIWNIPGASPIGGYAYYGVFFRWNGSAWIQAGPWSGGQGFTVAGPDQAIDPGAVTDKLVPSLPKDVAPPTTPPSSAATTN